MIFALISPELYLLLTTDRGWTPQEWQIWVTETVGRAVLRHAPAGAAGGGASGKLPGGGFA